LIVGRLIDRLPVRPLFQSIVAMQVLAFIIAALTSGWWFCGALLFYMVAVFGAIPFSDTLIARFIDDNNRSRVAGVRIAVSFGVSSITVLLLGPLVKMGGFTNLLFGMAVVAVSTWAALWWLPDTPVASTTAEQ
jgi:MFS family permease